MAFGPPVAAGDLVVGSGERWWFGVLRPSKLNAGSVGYYESTTERQPVAIGADMTDYYSEHGDRAPRVWCAGRTEAAEGQTLDRLGIVKGQELAAEDVERWFNEGLAPGGEHEQLGRAFVGPSSKTMPVKDAAGVAVLDADGQPVTYEKANGGTVRGWDLVVAAPKSVSMLHAIGDDGQRAVIESAHRDAIDQALAYLSRHGGYTRMRVAGEKNPVTVPSSALSGVVYEHRTSRNVDPHLHAHALLHNRVLNPATGEWTSIDGTSMMFETKAAGTVYQAALRAALTHELGVSWQQVDPRSGVADLTGLTREEIEAWSTRSSEIDQWCDAHGLSDHAGNQKSAQLETRVAKDTSLSDAQLRAGWGDRARAQGITAAQIGHGPVVTTDGEPLQGERLRLLTAQVTPEQVLEAVAQQASTFTRSEVVQAAAAALSERDVAPGEVLGAVEDLADAALDVAVSLEGAATAGDSLTRRLHSGQRWGDREGSIRYTTAGMLELEATATYRAAQRGAGLSSDPGLVRVGGLDLDQLSGMRALVASDRVASVMIAPAGAGKTTSLVAARAAWETDGRRVLGLAPTGRAAGQMRTDHAVAQADTIATLLGRLRRGQGSGWRAGDVVVVDEAGMVGSFTLARLIAQAAEDQVRMVLVGDPEQLQAVNQASGLFELLAEDLPDTVRLTQVYRQHDPHERVAGLGLRSDASEAQMRQAVAWYAEHDRLEAGDRFSMYEATLGDWRWATGEGMDAMMLAGTWQDAEALALSAQQWLVSEGRVDHRVTIALGDVDEHGVNRARPTVAGVGDLVMTRANDYQLRTDQGDTVRNGNTWRVERITAPEDSGSHQAERRVLLQRTGMDNPDRAWVPEAYLGEHARLAYGASINNSQGATMDATLSMFDEGRSAQNLVYTGMTRGRVMNKARIVAAAHDVDGHEHQGPPRRFTSTGPEAATMFADLLTRDRRDLSAHLTADRAARAARVEVGEKYGPDLAAEFEDAAAFTPAARARGTRDERQQAAAADTGPVPVAGPGHPRGQVASGQDMPVRVKLPTVAKAAPALEAVPSGPPLTETVTGQEPAYLSGQDREAPVYDLQVQHDTTGHLVGQVNGHPIDLRGQDAHSAVIRAAREQADRTDLAGQSFPVVATGPDGNSYRMTITPTGATTDVAKVPTSTEQTREQLAEIQETVTAAGADRAPVELEHEQRTVFEQLSTTERATMWQHYGSDPAIGNAGREVFSEYRNRHAEAFNARDVSMAGTPGRELTILRALRRGDGVPTGLQSIKLQSRGEIPQDRRRQGGETLVSYVRRVITDPAPHATIDLVRDEEQRLTRAGVTRDRLRAAREHLHGSEPTRTPHHDYRPDRGRDGPSMGM